MNEERERGRLRQRGEKESERGRHTKDRQGE